VAASCGSSSPPPCRGQLSLHARRFFRRRNLRRHTATSIAVIGVYSFADILLALWMAGWRVNGGFTWLVLILGFAAAAAYNFVICESLARQVDS
jgi:hypothetical protein